MHLILAVVCFSVQASERGGTVWISERAGLVKSGHGGVGSQPAMRRKRFLPG